jgi:hypothetical protein
MKRGSPRAIADMALDRKALGRCDWSGAQLQAARNQISRE